MTRGGWTKKACESCGKEGRPTGEICADCKLLIEEATAERERQGKLTRHLVRLHNKTPHWNPSYYDGDGSSEAKGGVVKAMTALVFAVGEPATGKHPKDSTPGLLPKKALGMGGAPHTGYDSMYHAYPLRFTNVQVAAFKALDKAIRNLHISSTKEAFEHGSDLLRRLGEGDLSLTDFEDGRKRHAE